MWNDLPEQQKQEYKKLILSFASLTGMFAQKATDDDPDVAPVINSKYQETAFQKSFGAVAEDIGNTSYDVSLKCNDEKYLIGIKTFGISSGDQKVAQFKAKHSEWAQLIDMMKNNANGIDDKETIDELNQDLYRDLATRIGIIRNARMDSSDANIKGFMVERNDTHVHSVYHVLMPSNKSQEPKIFVGETSYDRIDIEKIKVLGCTGKNYPTNFYFTDGNHVYKYTAADSQLHMNFNNKNIVCDEWNVKYADDAYSIFGKIADMVYPEEMYVAEDPVAYFTLIKKKEPVESYCWTIWNKYGETELYSGFNSFYGLGSKIGKEERKKRIQKIKEKYEDSIDTDIMKKIIDGVSSFLLDPATCSKDKAIKASLRKHIMGIVKEVGDENFESDLTKILFRPMDEMYIPIPDSLQFHKEHPDFFGKGIGKVKAGTSKLELSKGQRMFNLIFEPSGDSLPVFITQDNGKAIESAEKQTYLGEWVLRGVFQLDEYEPLTSKKLKDLNINGLRFSKYRGSDDIHVEFIWIDEDNPPAGYISRA